MEYLVNGRGPYELPKTFIYRSLYRTTGMWLTRQPPRITWVLVRVEKGSGEAVGRGTCYYASFSEESLRKRLAQLPTQGVIECRSAQELQKKLHDDLGYPYNWLDTAAQFMGNAASAVIPLTERLGLTKPGQDTLVTSSAKVRFVVGQYEVAEESQSSWTVALLSDKRSM